VSSCKLNGLTNIRTFSCLRQSIGHHLTCLRRSHQAGQSIVGTRERLLWRKGSNFCFCEGFRMTAHRDDSACTGAVVRNLSHHRTSRRASRMSALPRRADIAVISSRTGRTCRLILPDGQNTEFPVQPSAQKYSASPFARNSFIDSSVPPTEGRHAIVTVAARDAVDVAAR